MGKIIGIDLGTTNSCVAVMEGSEPVVIPNSEGRRTTPSIVAFVDNNERKVGDPAKRQAITNPKRTITSIKRFMGETLRQSGQGHRASILCGSTRRQQYPPHRHRRRLYSPQEISAIILQKMKKTAEDYLGTRSERGSYHCTGLLLGLAASGDKEAGEIAGLKVRPDHQRADGGRARLRFGQG